MTTRLLCFSGGYSRPRLAVLALEQIEAQIQALEPGQNLVVTHDGRTYPSSMTPLYTNGEEVLAVRHHDRSVSRSFDRFDQYSVVSQTPLESGEVWRMEIEPKAGALLQQRDTVFCSKKFHESLHA